MMLKRIFGRSRGDGRADTTDLEVTNDRSCFGIVAKTSRPCTKVSIPDFEPPDFASDIVRIDQRAVLLTTRVKTPH